MILCFSAIRAKQMCEKLVQNAKFCQVYKFDEIFYLDCGVMELFDNGFEFVSEFSQDFSQNQNSNLNLNSNQSKTQNFSLNSQPNSSEIQALNSTQKAQISSEISALKATNSTQILNSQISAKNLKHENPLVSQTIANIREKYLSNKRAFVVAFSGGKDSTCVLQLMYEMLCDLPPNLRRKTFAIASNTLVEAPHIDKFLHDVVNSINAHALKNGIPFKIIMVAPSLKDDFWVNLVGKGYPSPTRTFRWCTDRLKITPTKAAVAKITREFGSCILLLGTRKAESANRKRSIQKRVLSEDGYSKHDDYPNTLIYSPIVEWDTDSVWGYLMSHKPRWDKDHSELFALYSKASGDECQFITDLRQSSCGGSRFGCWVCTVVNEDKSMQGFIDAGAVNLKPLNEFRNYIKALRENKNARADYKRDGRAVWKIGGMGPFLSKTRLEIFERLLECEAKFKQNGGENLITNEQILAVQKEWDKDFDFNKSAIKIAQKFDRLKGYKMAESKILHAEILKGVANELDEGKLDALDLENLIAKSNEIFNNSSMKGPKNAGIQIKGEIEKLISDKTAKEV